MTNRAAGTTKAKLGYILLLLERTSDSIDGPSRPVWSRCTRPGSAAPPAGTPPPCSPTTFRSPPVRLPASPVNGAPCPANGLLPPFFAVAALAEAQAGEKREENPGTGGRLLESPRSPFPGGLRVGVPEGVCDGVTVGVGVGVQQGSATADRRPTATVVPRAAARSWGLRGRGALPGGGGDDELDLERSGQRQRGRKNARGTVWRKCLTDCRVGCYINTHTEICVPTSRPTITLQLLSHALRGNGAVRTTTTPTPSINVIRACEACTRRSLPELPKGPQSVDCSAFHLLLLPINSTLSIRDPVSVSATGNCLFAWFAAVRERNERGWKDKSKDSPQHGEESTTARPCSRREQTHGQQ